VVSSQWLTGKQLGDTEGGHVARPALVPQQESLSIKCPLPAGLPAFFKPKNSR
jgi:hypothetical protein